MHDVKALVFDVFGTLVDLLANPVANALPAREADFGAYAEAVGKGLGDRQRVMIWNMFVDMLQLLDTLVATHTDYAALRRALAGNDCLMFMRDALVKMSLELNRIALDVSRGRKVQYRSSAKAELRAIEYGLDFRQQITALALHQQGARPHCLRFSAFATMPVPDSLA